MGVCCRVAVYGPQLGSCCWMYRTIISVPYACVEVRLDGPPHHSAPQNSKYSSYFASRPQLQDSELTEYLCTTPSNRRPVGGWVVWVPMPCPPLLSDLLRVCDRLDASLPPMPRAVLAGQWEWYRHQPIMQTARQQQFHWEGLRTQPPCSVPPATAQPHTCKVRHSPTQAGTWRVPSDPDPRKAKPSYSQYQERG